MASRSLPEKSHSLEWLFYWLALIGLALAVSGCGARDAPQKLTGATMGTTWSLTYIETGDGQSPEKIQAGIAAVLAAVNTSMSTYEPESEISRFNRLQVGETVAMTDPFLRVFETAREVSGLTDGAYDVTIGPLVDLWGFGSAGFGNELPDDSAIALAMKKVGQNHLEVDREQSALRKLQEVELDFSSLAKGYAVDEIGAYLRQQGVTRYLVEVGGEMALAGQSPRGDLWQIAIEEPEPGRRAIAAALQLTDLAVATSGDYRNYFDVNGKRYSHAIDPRTGYPIDHELVSVTVVHKSAMQADAWATALIVLGMDDALALAEAQGLAVYCIARRGAELTHRYSSGIAPHVMSQ